MKRRTFLGTLGALSSLGTLHYTTREPVSKLEVRFFLSEGASDYPGIESRVSAYLEGALEYPFWSVDVSMGGIVSTPTEDGADPVRTGRWPLTVGAGVTGMGNANPARDVNVLITDGQMSTAPTGYAIPHVASVGGARHLASLDVPTDFDGYDGYTRPALTAQILLHEVGHTLGLRHEHGHIERHDGKTAVTPMVSAYAWDDEFDATSCRCGTTYPTDRDTGRLLSHRFSDCALERLTDYAGGLRP
ncbi:peptidase M10A and M12B matrixin and adamalysin [Natrialbaceae archaeon A-CW2]